VEWVRSRLLSEKRISPEDMDIIQILDDPEEIVKTVKRVVIL
jgi:hypothetical protein